MGLDTYPSRSPDDTVLTLEDELSLMALDVGLCEWLGFGSFRGKVYLDVVDRVAGASLMREWIPPEEVAELAQSFEACDPEAVARATSTDHYPATAAEVRSLARFFRLCADLGLGLRGSW
jgi:hypothetical protein